MSKENNAIDLKLVKLTQAGNHYAFDHLVKKYQGKVLQLVSRFVPDRSEALDLVQETFVKAYLALSNFREESEFYTWLYRIAINTAKNYLVFVKRRPPPLDLDADFSESVLGKTLITTIETPENFLLRDELEAIIAKAIEQLPKELKMAFILREFDEMGYEEIATALDCPVGTVRSRIFRARETINQMINEYLLHG